MTREEKIEQLKNQITEKKEEIADLENQVIQEMIADFYAVHGLKEGQHFLYAGRECVCLGKAAQSLELKAFPMTANGGISQKGVLINSNKPVKPL